MFSKEPLRNRGELSFEDALQGAHEIVGRRYAAAQDAQKRIRVQQGFELYLPQKTLVFANGHLGAGKTRATNTLEECVPIVVVDKDDIGDMFTESRKNDIHARMRNRCYQVLYAVADSHLRAGRSVLLDVPFNDRKDFYGNEEWEGHMRELAGRSEADLKVIWCVATSDEKERRILVRTSTRETDRSPAEIRALAERMDIPPIPFDHILFDTEVPDHEKTRVLQEFLGISLRQRVPTESSANS